MNLKGKKVFIAGVGDDQGFGWAIAKELFSRGATILVGTWAPVYRIFVTSLKQGKFDESRKMEDGRMLEIEAIYPLDASYDKPEDVPSDVKENKRYVDLSHYTISEVAEKVAKEHGAIDMLVHSLANAPEVKRPLLETSRSGYLAAMSASSYSFVSLVSHFAPHMKPSGSILTLTYIASERAIPKYGGGMSSAKAALESDVRTLAFEAGRRWHLRLNAISAGPLRSRAARAIGMIDDMIAYSMHNAPLAKELDAEEVAKAASFLLSQEASAITGVTLYVDNGLHAMGMAIDSASLKAPPSASG